MDSMWAFLTSLVTLLTTTIGGVFFLLEQRKTRFRVENVEKLAEPTGNGWAGDVSGSLARLEKQVGDVNKKMDDHISDHVQAGLRGWP